DEGYRNRMSARDKVKEAMTLMLEGFEKMAKANQVLGGGPHSYYAKRMVEYADVLYERYAPFKKGERAVICKQPDCDNDWRHHKQDLQKGAKCTVEHLEYYDGGWRIDVILDEETWIDMSGARHAVSSKHTFRLHEDELVKI